MEEEYYLSDIGHPDELEVCAENELNVHSVRKAGNIELGVNQQI